MPPSLPFSDASFDTDHTARYCRASAAAPVRCHVPRSPAILNPDGYAVIHTLPNRWVYDFGYRLGRLFLPTSCRP